MRHDCLITARLAGPCATCRQPAWPAHVRGLLIYCEACCGCGRGGAQAAGSDAPAGQGETQVPRRDLRQNISASKCSGGNFMTDWRFT
jgi:hypothetical protein